MEATAGSQSFWDSTCTRWHEDARSCWVDNWSGREFAEPAAGASRRKKNASPNRTDCPSAATRNRRRSDAGAEVDAPRHPKNRAPTAPAEHPHRGPYGGSVAEANGILLAGESQEPG